MKQRTPFQVLSNLISIAADTGDRDTLDACDAQIATCLAEGKINLPEAGELTHDCEVALDSLGRNDYLDEGFAAIAQGL